MFGSVIVRHPIEANNQAMTDYTGMYFLCSLIFLIPIGAFLIFIGLALLIRKYHDARWLYIVAAVFALFCAYIACAQFFRFDN